MEERIAYRGITFDDVLLEPAYSGIMPNEVDTHTQLTRNIRLAVPILSSPMDTVTESDMAVAMAQEGGIGIIHKNMPAEQQALEVERVKRAEHGVIVDPVTLPPDATAGEAWEIMERRNIGGVPVTKNGKLMGILTRRDLRFLPSRDVLFVEVMTKDKLVTAPDTTTLEAAERILLENKVEKLLLVDEAFQLKGLITIKDIDKNLRYPKATKDARGRLRVGAAIGVHDYERAERLIDKGVDVLCVDSAHGHSKNVIETVATLKNRWSIDVIAGNVATTEGARDLIQAGADAVKVGIGPGSICTTRVIAGVGVPQLSAIHNAGGDVLKLMGDGVLAIFKADNAGDACASALRAEAAVRETVGSLNVRRAEAGRPVTNVYLGLHIGEVFYGNIGSDERLDFTVVGPAVNEVSRIASICRSVDRHLVVSSEFAEQAPQAQRERLVSLGRYALRGVGRAQELFTLDPGVL